MFDLFNIYDCPNCGKVLSDEVEFIEIELGADEWGKLPFCDKCSAEVRVRCDIDPVTKQEIFHYEQVDEQRAHDFADRFKHYDED